MQEAILKLYFEDKLKQIEIAKRLNISKYKVSRTVTKDPRYKKEKEDRKAKNKQKNKIETKNYIYKKRKSGYEEYMMLKLAHEQASRELSEGKRISNRAFRNWNPSIYKYDEKSKSYKLKKDIVTGFDVPKKISWKNS